MAEEVKNSVFEDFHSRILSAIGKITDDEIAAVLKREKLTVGVAESLTGGLICERLSAAAGASDYFVGGIVCYTNRVKVMELNISPSLIANMGPVSDEVARSMAENVRKKFRTSIGLSATGVAGPATVSPPKPIGLTYIAISSDKGTESKELKLVGNRREIREKASQAALGLLWLHVTGQQMDGPSTR